MFSFVFEGFRSALAVYQRYNPGVILPWHIGYESEDIELYPAGIGHDGEFE